jgi:hypothetical protein
VKTKIEEIRGNENERVFHFEVSVGSPKKLHPSFVC